MTSSIACMTLLSACSSLPPRVGAKIAGPLYTLPSGAYCEPPADVVPAPVGRVTAHVATDMRAFERHGGRPSSPSVAPWPGSGLATESLRAVAFALQIGREGRIVVLSHSVAT